MDKFYIISSWVTNFSGRPDIVTGPLFTDYDQAIAQATHYKKRYGKECAVLVTEISRKGSDDILFLRNE